MKKEDDNETFCEDLILPTPGNISLYRSRFSTKKISPTKNLNENLMINEYSQVVKSEKNLDESVFIVPEKSEEIICIQESPTLHFDLNNDNSRTLLDEYDLNINDEKKKKHEVVEFLMVSPIRKKADKAKQPGYDCPDCEKVSVTTYYSI